MSAHVQACFAPVVSPQLPIAHPDSPIRGSIDSRSSLPGQLRAHPAAFVLRSPLFPTKQG